MDTLLTAVRAPKTWFNHSHLACAHTVNLVAIVALDHADFTDEQNHVTLGSKAEVDEDAFPGSYLSIHQHWQETVSEQIQLN